MKHQRRAVVDACSPARGLRLAALNCSICRGLGPRKRHAEKGGTNSASSGIPRRVTASARENFFRAGPDWTLGAKRREAKKKKKKNKGNSPLDKASPESISGIILTHRMRRGVPA